MSERRLSQSIEQRNADEIGVLLCIYPKTFAGSNVNIQFNRGYLIAYNAKML